MVNIEVFEPFPKIPRFKHKITITEKIDGTNAQIVITENGQIRAASRNRWISPEDDNFGFANWVEANKEHLIAELGPGRHYGEWWGKGIQRGYGLDEKRFSLFNVYREEYTVPRITHTIPVMLLNQDLNMADIDHCLEALATDGSIAAPGFMKPEGIVIYHHQQKTRFKITLDGDAPKWQMNAPSSSTPT